MMFGSVSEHFTNPRHVKDEKLVLRARMQYFEVPNLWSIHSRPLDPKMMFRSVSEHFANLRHVKDAKLVFRAWIHYLGVLKLWSIHSSPLDPKWCLWVFEMISRTFGMCKIQNYCSSLNALFRGTKVVKHPFKSIGPKNIFARVSDNFTNLQRVKRCKTCVLGLNALFRGTKVVKHPFWFIGPKMMFGSVSWLFANFGHIKDAKLVFEPECTTSGYQSCEASILVHWTQSDVWECFVAFH
jgi:hypothetical protein